MTRKYVVIVPVADLRGRPVAATAVYEHDALQESQLLYGEQLLGYEEEEGWLRVEALEQQRCSAQGVWSGYPGWVQRNNVLLVETFLDNNIVVNSLWADIVDDTGAISSLAEGTKLHGIERRGDRWVVLLPSGAMATLSADDVRELSPRSFDIGLMMKMAEGHLGHPYLWGGRSAYRPSWKGCLTSVDCSGFVNLLYRVQGVDIPRDAHDQYMKSLPLLVAELRQGDLLFLFSEKNPDRIDHVMMYAGGEELIEATGRVQKVRKVSFKERFDITKEDMAQDRRAATASGWRERIKCGRLSEKVDG